MEKIRGVFMRGGTSKGVYFHAGDLPADPAPPDNGHDPRTVDLGAWQHRLGTGTGPADPVGHHRPNARLDAPPGATT
jgi:hypothetical protein